MNGLSPRIPKRPLFWPDAILTLQETLRDAEEPVYIVGGAVRDAFLHRPIKDIDLAVREHSIHLARQITNALNGDVFVLDAERGVARVLIGSGENKMSIDVARFRGDDLLADLTDRDFTINAMAVDLRQNLNLLIDPLNGEQDAADKVIRRCNIHTVRDDPIRALRAARQSVQLGLHIERETLQDLRAEGPRMIETSAERIRDEFIHLLSLEKVSSALRVTERLGLLELVIPEVGVLRQLPEADNDHWARKLAIVERLSHMLTAISPARTDHTAASFHLGILVMQLDRYRKQLQAHLATNWPNERPQRALLVLAALLYRQNRSVRAVEHADALRLSKAEKQRLVAITRESWTMPAIDRRTLHRFWSRLGAAGIDVCLLALACYLGTGDIHRDQDTWLALVDQARIALEAYFERYEELVAPPPLINGYDLMNQFNLKPGPIINELLTFIREEQAVGTVKSVDDVLVATQNYLEKRS